MWAHEFKAWQKEYGQNNINMDEAHEGNNYNDDQVTDDMQWADDMWNMLYPFMSDPDMICPLFDMVGPGWEEGCRKQMGQCVTNDFILYSFVINSI